MQGRLLPARRNLQQKRREKLNYRNFLHSFYISWKVDPSGPQGSSPHHNTRLDK